MKLYPNPYAQLDADGMLAGACPLLEGLRGPAQMPMREHVCAKRKVVSFEKRGDDGKRHPALYGSTSGLTAHGEQGLSRTKSRWAFAAEPFDVRIEAADQRAYYHFRLKKAELFEAGPDGSPPIDKLTKARAAAIAGFKAAYGKEPPTSEWAAQFPLDGAVAAAMSPRAESIKAESPKAKTAKE